MEYLLEQLGWLAPTLLVTAPGREKPPGREHFAREVVDAVAGEGPLRGVLTALEATETQTDFCVLSLKHGRLSQLAPADHDLTVIVPAFNEERVIESTIRSLLNSDYPNFEIVVVDDGSSDRTSDVVREKFGNHALVHLFTEPNAGKALALNFGLRHAKGDVIVALDAVTQFPPPTIRALARRFVDPKVGAVAGNAKVGNRINIVTRWQALEYITSQNMDRRAFASLNCITVVPGSVGAWRRELIEQCGGFSTDTLAEDQDLTLQIGFFHNVAVDQGQRADPRGSEIERRR